MIFTAPDWGEKKCSTDDNRLYLNDSPSGCKIEAGKPTEAYSYITEPRLLRVLRTNLSTGATHCGGWTIIDPERANDPRARASWVYDQGTKFWDWKEGIWVDDDKTKKENWFCKIT